MRRFAPAALALALVACSDEAPTNEPAAKDCAPRQVATAAGCVDVGALEESCADGFVFDDGRCLPTVPPAPCVAGTMAIPGDAACRPVGECPAATWGAIDGGSAPQWVDAAYAGGDSDGTQARPWTRLSDAIAAATDGAVIGIATGRYAEDIAIEGKALHLRGVCAEQVAIEGQSAGGPAVFVRQGAASGTSFEDVAVTGLGAGIAVSGATGVRITRAWVHDLGSVGVDVEDPLGPADLTLSDSLVENTGDTGAFAVGATLVVERSHVRAGEGRAIAAVVSTWGSDAPASLQITQSLVEDGVGMSVFVSGSPATIDATVIRGGRASDVLPGVGIASQVNLATGQAPTVTITRSALVENGGAGISARGTALSIAHTSFLGTRAGAGPDQVLTLARGAIVTDDEDLQRSQATITDTTFDGLAGLGLLVAGSDVTVERTLMRRFVDGLGGRARGLSLQPSEYGGSPSSGALRSVLVDQVEELGILAGGSNFTFDDVVIRGIAPNTEGLFGDGIAVFPDTTLAARRVTVAGAARAGVSVFAGALTLEAAVLRCLPIALALEPLNGREASLTDDGGNECGCDDDDVCRATSAGIEPPEPL